MFQTIGAKGGFIQLSTFGNKTTIEAWCGQERLGSHYTTVAGARGAITKAHRAWRRKADAEHHASLHEDRKRFEERVVKCLGASVP